MSSVNMSLFRHSICRTALLATVFMGIAALPAKAAFENLAGTWSAEALISESEAAPVDCMPSSMRVNVAAADGSIQLDLDGGPAASLKLDFARSGDTPIFTEKSGWMKRLGLSDSTTRERLIAHEAMTWARETDDGAVIYRTRIDESGGLNVFRVAMDAVDGGVFITLTIDRPDCQTGPLTALMTQS